MSLSRSVLLWMSENKWMQNNVPRWWFVRKAVKKFMPGESVEDALNAAQNFSAYNIPTVFTKLGENITQISEAAVVRDHYLRLINKISERKLDVEISLKLTQLGFDLSEEEAFKNFSVIAKHAKEKLGNTVFIDMEGSAYTQRTIDFYKRIKLEHSNAGLCLQAYLRRTDNDLNELFGISLSLRLVKGAYKEPREIALPEKWEVDRNYFDLSSKMMNEIKKNGERIIYATHDQKLIAKIIEESKKIGLPKEKLEFQMLYGIKTPLQKQLAKEGYKIRVLISYGESWYPWYVRRLAERPANIWFVLKNLF
ncbi:MAG: proline dehydrogenase family protein [Ignavibacteriales bacterium]|nr:proline dehydrogenase family protein [Ignavibacteriales bacterium]